jgi:subtilisin family serine protease
MKIRLLIGFVLISLGLSAQEIADGVYWVYFTDKDGTGYSIAQPGEFLSERSVNRRALQDLAIDHHDRPVNQDYVQEIRDMGIEVTYISRWLNGIAMTSMDAGTFQEVMELSYTDTVPWFPQSNDLFFPQPSGAPRFEAPLDSPPGYDYGIATEQVSMLRTNLLHERGYTGKGVWIAVLDGGFRNVDSLASFEKMISEGRILETRNYVNDLPVFRLSSSHGMNVLSTMGGEWNGYMVGTAPHASYLLCTTEDEMRETRLEEIAWIEAAEYADSLGADVINTSLGYSDFDGNSFDYTYRDMDGHSSFISRGASLTASRGMVACISAGNQGNDLWFYITSPADAFDILAVGAVDSTNLIGFFSSRGPTYDARIKPDVTAMGVASGVQSSQGGVARGNGTSFASPILAGSVASLWQAYPELPAIELIHRVRQSGDRHKNPDSTYGFGLPNFNHAYHAITSIPVHFKAGELELWPNPAREHLMIRIPEEIPEEQEIRFYDMQGRISCTAWSGLPGEIVLPPALVRGIYIVEIMTPSTIYRSRLIVQ